MRFFRTALLVTIGSCSSSLGLGLTSAAASVHTDATAEEPEATTEALLQLRGGGGAATSDERRNLGALPSWLSSLSLFGQQSAATEAGCNALSPLGADAFNITKYTEKSWYVQKQQINPYQPENALFCVTATYNIQTDCDGYATVLNAGRRNGVDGEEILPGDLCAQQVNAGELRVAPCCFKGSFATSAGPYWVVGLDPDYEWAIVSGGQLTEVKEEVNGETFCTTRIGDCVADTNGSGLWWFSRTPVASDATLAKIEAKMTELKISSADLKDVPQAGCTYPQHIKS